MTDSHALPTPLPGSPSIPSFAHARVRDALHLGVITSLPDTPMEANEGGSSVAWASRTSIVDRPENGNCPVSSSKRITPTEYRSPR